ncbi:MAG: TIGR04149 family rSAM-modified RiPP [Bacteroidales bacterium]|jgi:natural product precursor|nr:TIGR04149 family rSAM-modified RiPP [Bacteroidales bacterium]
MKKLKLTNLENNNLSEKEMNNLRGGNWTCGCSCYYANSGGSSSGDNADANADIGPGAHSRQGNNQYTRGRCTPKK